MMCNDDCDIINFNKTWRHEMAKMDYIKCDRVSHVTFICSIRGVCDALSFPEVIVSRGVTRWGSLTYKTHAPTSCYAAIVISWKSKTMQRRETVVVLLTTVVLSQWLYRSVKQWHFKGSLKVTFERKNCDISDRFCCLRSRRYIPRISYFITRFLPHSRPKCSCIRTGHIRIHFIAIS